MIQPDSELTDKSAFTRLALLNKEHPKTGMFWVDCFTEQELAELVQSGQWYRSGTALKPTPTNTFYYDLYLEYNLIDAIF